MVCGPVKKCLNLRSKAKLRFAGLYKRTLSFTLNVICRTSLLYCFVYLSIAPWLFRIAVCLSASMRIEGSRGLVLSVAVSGSKSG